LVDLPKSKITAPGKAPQVVRCCAIFHHVGHGVQAVGSWSRIGDGRLLWLRMPKTSRIVGSCMSRHPTGAGRLTFTCGARHHRR
jgi:hypothetical protein